MLDVFLQIINTGLIIFLAFRIAVLYFSHWYERIIVGITVFASVIIGLEAIEGYLLLSLTPLTSFVLLLLIGLGIMFFRKEIILSRPIATAMEIKETIPFLDKLLFAILIIAGIYVLFAIVVLPEFGVDTIVYHISNLPYWFQNKNLLPFPTAATYATFSPLDLALLNLWFFQLLGIDLIFELPNLFLAVLAGLAVYGIAIEMKLSKSSARWAAGFFLTMPVVMANAKGCYTDLPIAALFIAAVFFRLKYQDQPNHRNLIILATLTGLVVGTKHIGLIFGGVICLSLISSGTLQLITRKKWLAPVSMSLVLLTGGFWYLKNWILFHNPLYPQKIAMFGHTIFRGGEVDNVTHGLGNLIKNLVSLRDIIDGGAWITANTSSWGGQTFVFIFPVAILGVWLLFRLPDQLRTKLRLLCLLTVPPFIIFLYMLTHYSWWYKYSIWFPALIAIGFGALLDYFQQKSLKVIALAMFIISCAAGSTFGGPFIDKDRFKTFLHLPISQNASAIFGNFMPAQNPFAYIYKLRDVKRIGYSEGGESFIYPLFDNRYTRKVFLYQGKSDSSEQVGEFIRTNSLDLIYAANPIFSATLRRMENLKEVFPNVFRPKSS